MWLQNLMNEINEAEGGSSSPGVGTAASAMASSTRVKVQSNVSSFHNFCFARCGAWVKVTDVCLQNLNFTYGQLKELAKRLETQSKSANSCIEAGMWCCQLHSRTRMRTCALPARARLLDWSCTSLPHPRNNVHTPTSPHAHFMFRSRYWRCIQGVRRKACCSVQCSFRYTHIHTHSQSHRKLTLTLTLSLTYRTLFEHDGRRATLAGRFTKWFGKWKQERDKEKEEQTKIDR